MKKSSPNQMDLIMPQSKLFPNKKRMSGAGVSLVRFQDRRAGLMQIGEVGGPESPFKSLLGNQT